MIGQRLLHYQIVEKLGEGGMGVVYKARDTHLNRFVALKVLPAEKVADPERKARFVQEAKAASALNHSGIITIHDVAQHDGTDFIIMEYVAGQTLDRMIPRRGMRPGEALKIGVQIAAALARAHSAGIIHRDLKPSNIMVDKQGQAKVLDFGLAKLEEAVDQGDDLTRSLQPQTQAGIVVGTVSYMSPEQAEGRSVDARSDIFSFGSLLYEMLSGRRAFQRDSKIATLAAVLQEEPAPLGETVPAELARVVSRCLRKDPERRYQHMDDLKVALSEMKEESESGGIGIPGATLPVRRRVPWMRLLPWLAVCALSGVVVWQALRPKRPSQPQSGSAGLPITHATLSLPPEAPLAVSRLLPLGLTYPSLALSPDGTQLVYVASVGQSTQLYRRPLHELVARPIADTEGAHYPFFSPDGRWVGFFANGKLKKISLLGGSAVTLDDAGNQVQAACWGDDGHIYFQPYPSLRRISDGGGTGTLLEGNRGTYSLRTPDFLPGAKWMLGTFRTPASSEGGDFRPVSAFSPSTGDVKAVVDRGYSPRFLPANYLVFVRGGGLHAVAFDPLQAIAMDQPVPVLEGVLSNALECVAQYAVSANGTLVYAAGAALDRTTPAWVGRNGQVEKLPIEPRSHGALRLSPDGGKFAVSIPDARDNIWIFDAATGKGAPLTEPGVNRFPVWTPDGQRLIFCSWRNDRLGIYAKSVVSGDRPAMPLLVADDSESRMHPYTCSADGRMVISYIYTAATGKVERIGLALDGSGKVEPANVPTTTGNFIRYSSDGRWLSFTSERSGRSQVYLRNVATGQEHQVSFDGGEENTWSAKGDELFFRHRDAWFVAALTFAPVFRAEVRELFKGPFLNVPGYSYDTAPDGQRFLVLMPEHPETPITELHVIVNWTEAVKRRLSAGAATSRVSAR